MGTVIRPEVSEKNRYWISRHRYYELKHFCLQYSDWESAYRVLDGFAKQNYSCAASNKSSVISKPTEKCAGSRLYYYDRMELVKRTAQETTAVFDAQLFKAVTEGLSFEHIRAQTGLPCSKDDWYELYRKFFWLLDKARG